MIPVNLIVDSFDRLFRSENGIEIDDIDLNAPIVPQLEKFAQENQIPLNVGWKVELSKKVKQRFDPETNYNVEGKWKELFEKLQ